MYCPSLKISNKRKKSASKHKLVAVAIEALQTGCEFVIRSGLLWVSCRDKKVMHAAAECQEKTTGLPTPGNDNQSAGNLCLWPSLTIFHNQLTYTEELATKLFIAETETPRN
jgi:hypothetical protein